MSKNEQKLKFENLNSEVELMSVSEQSFIIGGKNVEYEYAFDSNGNWYYREAGNDTWNAGTNLNTVVISAPVGGGSTSTIETPGHIGSAGTSGGGGGGNSGTLTPSTDILPGTNDAWKSLMFGTSEATLTSQYSEIYDANVVGKVGSTTFAGTIYSNSSSRSPLNFTTTVTDGVISSYEMSFDAYSIGYLTEGGFSLSGTTGGPVMSVGFSLKSGVIIGQSFVNGTEMSGNYYNYKPGAPLLTGIAILAALFSDGASAALFPDLYGGLAI